MSDSPTNSSDRRRFLVVFPASMLTDDQAAAIERSIQAAVINEIAKLGLGIEMSDPSTAIAPQDVEEPWWYGEFKGGTAGQFPIFPEEARAIRIVRARDD